MKTAVIYARVSTARQAEDELPVESQIERCQEKATELDCRVDRIFRDEGISGATDARPAFRDCIAYCELIAPDFLITWSTSRFARNKVDAGLYKIRLERAGVDIAYASQNFDRGSDAGWMTESIMELFDEFYSRQVAADTLRSMMKNANDGYWNGGRVVYGYRPEPAPDNPKRKRLVPEPDEAAVVRDIFTLRLTGYGAQAIAGILDDRGERNRGKRWNKTNVTGLLKNPAVIGQVVFGRKDRKTGKNRPREHWILVPSHEPIVDQDLFDQVQAMMADATPQPDTSSPHSSHLFTGILRCPDGSCMQVKSGKGRTRRYYYYDCNSALKYNGKSSPMRADLLDEFLIQRILDDVLNAENLRDAVRDIHKKTDSWEKDRLNRLNETQAAISRIEEKNSNIFELFELYGKRTPNLEDLTIRLRANKKKIQDFEQQLMAIQGEDRPELAVSDQDVTDLVESLRYIIKTNDNPKKLRVWLKSFIDAIWVNEDRTEVRIEYSPEVIVRNREPVLVPSTADWLPDPVLLGTKSLVLRLPERFHRRRAA